MASISISSLLSSSSPCRDDLSRRFPNPIAPLPSFPLLTISIFARPSLSISQRSNRTAVIRSAVDGDYSSKRSSSSEPRETILLPGCDYNHWLIVMEFPKDPAPTREQMIDTYLNTLATVLGSMEEAKKNMYAFSTTTYTGFQCTVSEETSEKFKGLPGVLWVLPDSYIDVKNKDYGGKLFLCGCILIFSRPIVLARGIAQCSAWQKRISICLYVGQNVAKEEMQYSALKKKKLPLKFKLKYVWSTLSADLEDVSG